MWRVVAVLGLAGFCLAAPQNRDDGLDGLIADVFGKPGQQQKPVNQPQQNVNSFTTTKKPDRGLEDLIDQVFGSGSTTTQSSLILGTKNTLMPKNDNCECVPYYQCQEGKILDNGIGLIDIRSAFADNDQTQGASGACDNYLDVCCSPPNIVSPDQKVTPPPTQRRGCGQRHPEGVGFRITGAQDNEAQFGEFPWMVAILKEENVGASAQKLNVYQCGGALIHPQIVLTAAHCVNGKRATELKIRAGEWDTQTKNEIYPHQDRNVRTVIVHEDFNSGALYNDFALLILAQPVELMENVDVVCLPEANEVFDIGTRCFASGWGKDIYGKEGHYQVILKRVDLPVVAHNTCQNSLRQTRLGKYFVLDNSFMCAGGEPGKDTCKGDGGSPLVCPLKNDPTRFAQVGIVAWGIGCGENGTPGVYANVAAARRWIDSKVALNNFNSNSYLPN